MGKTLPKIHLVLLTLLSFSLFTSVSFPAIKKDSKQAQEYRDKGYEAQRLGNLDMALSYYQRAIESDPSYAVAYNDIGIVLESRGLNDKAKEAYLKTISLDPNYLSAYYNLAALCEKEGDFQKAAYYWKMRMSLGDWSDNWTWKAKEHLENLQSKVPELASKDIALIANSSGDPKRAAKYHIYRGRQYASDGDYVSALKEFNTAIALDPQNYEIEQLIEETQKKTLLYN